MSNFFFCKVCKKKINEDIPEFVNSNFLLVNSSGRAEELGPLVGSWGYLGKHEKRWRKSFCLSWSARPHCLHPLAKLKLSSSPPLQARTETHCTATRRQFPYFSCFHTEISAHFRHSNLLCKYQCPCEETHTHSPTQMEFPLNMFQPLPSLKQREKIHISMESRITYVIACVMGLLGR